MSNPYKEFYEASQHVDGFEEIRKEEAKQKIESSNYISSWVNEGYEPDDSYQGAL